MEEILDVGCGCQTRGTLNLDFNHNSPADMIYDLNRIPYPFSDKQFKKVLAYHVLEHLDNPERVLNELRRIAEVVEIKVPHCKSMTAKSDATHKHTFNTKWFSVYAKKYQVNFETKVRFDIERFSWRLPFVWEIAVWLW